MKKIALFLLLTFSSVSMLLADIVPQADAAKVAKNHYFTHTNGIEYGSIILNLAFTKAKDGEPVYYIYNVGDNQGL